jgi:phage-related protein
MAEKHSTLSIVLRTVDKATAGIRAVNERIARLTAPVRQLSEGLSGMAKDAGLPQLVDGFKGVGGAAKGLLKTLLGVGGLAVAAGLGLKALVDDFDDLGDKAEQLGVSVNFLAQMRYAAERSGAEVGQLDDGLKSFVQNIGQARAGTGKLTSFLKLVSPALLKQLKGTKSNEEAFLLLADAMAKVEDPAKRLALAQKTVGNSALAPLLARGSTGIGELRQRYLELAGSQEAAAAAAGPVDDSMKDLKAATDGIKAALVEGLGPALGQIIEQLKAWFAENRERIAEWSAAIGKKLPGAITAFVEAFMSALGTVREIIDGIGGLKTVAVAVAAAIVGPLISSVYSLGVALLTTPVGWIVGGVAAIAAGVYLLIKNWSSVKAFFRGLWDGVKKIFGAAFEAIKVYFLNFTPLGAIIKHWQPIKEFFVGLWDGITSVFETAWAIIKRIVEKVTGAVDAVTGAVGSVADFLDPFGGGGVSLDQVTNQVLNATRAPASEARVTVDFANAPRGTRVAADPRSSADVDFSVGYQMNGIGL